MNDDSKIMPRTDRDLEKSIFQFLVREVEALRNALVFKDGSSKYEQYLEEANFYKGEKLRLVEKLNHSEIKSAMISVVTSQKDKI